MGQVNSGSGRTTGGPVVGGNKPLVEYSKYALGDEDEKLDIENLKKRKKIFAKPNILAPQCHAHCGVEFFLTL